VTAAPFGEILEAAANLTLDEQEALVDILSRRMAQERRARLLRDIRDADAGFRRGECQPISVQELMREISS
jgi:hypothetical protein